MYSRDRQRPHTAVSIRVGLLIQLFFYHGAWPALRVISQRASLRLPLKQNINDQKDKDDIVYLANKIISGKNNEEIYFTQKRLVKPGFFERFFNLFR